MKNFLFASLLVLSCTSCWDKTDNDYNNVQIRLENLTGHEIMRASTGRRIYKPGGLNFVDFSHDFDRLKNNQLTDFYDTQGLFQGYDSFRGRINDETKTWVLSDRETELQTAGAYDCEWENPFTNNFWEGFCLEKGRYTYKITLRDDLQAFMIDIIKE